MSKTQYILDTWVSRARSESAREKYSTHTKEFFDIVYGKSVKDITAKDLKELLPITIDTKYKDELKRRGQKEHTIKQKMGNVSQYMHKLSVNKVFADEGVDYPFIIQESLSTKDLKDDSGKYARMSYEDMIGFQDWLVEVRYTSKRYGWKAKYYSTLVDLMYVTGARLSATFQIKWSDIKYQKDDLNQYSHVIHVLDKGNKKNKYPVTEEFFNHLKANLDPKNEEYLFESVSQQGLTKDMKQYCEEIGLDEEQAFTPHSLRGLAITTVYERSNDIVKTSRFAKHASIETTTKYIHDVNNMLESGSYVLSGKVVEKSDIEGLTKSQLIEIIGDKSEMLYKVYNEAKNRGFINE